MTNGEVQLEDPRTFWERSNARLGVDPSLQDPAGRRKGRGPLEYPCSVCGTMVMLDRWPKHRHDVRCEPCKQTVSTLLTDEDRASLRQMDDIGRPTGTRIEGLPELTPEDLEAIAEMKARNAGDLGPMLRGGRRRRRGGAANGDANGEGRRRRRGNGASAGNGGAEKADGDNGGRRKRRRRRGDRKADAGSVAPSPTSPDA